MSEPSVEEIVASVERTAEWFDPDDVVAVGVAQLRAVIDSWRKQREALEKIALRSVVFPEKREGYGSMAVIIARIALNGLTIAGEK